MRLDSFRAHGDLDGSENGKYLCELISKRGMGLENKQNYVNHYTRPHPLQCDPDEGRKKHQHSPLVDQRVEETKSKREHDERPIEGA